MKLTVVGCSGSAPGPESPASCYLIQAQHGGRLWSICLDLGNGSLGVLQRHLDPRLLDAVVVSHLHPDHCLDLCSLYVVRRYAPEPPQVGRLPVLGPPGSADRMARAYGVEEPESMEGQFQFSTLDEGWESKIGPFTLTPYRMCHPVETFGLRVEADGAVIAYTGDTDSCENLAPLMRGADVVFADCAFIDGRDAQRGIHMSGSRAAAAARDAGGVRKLVLTHLPSWNDPTTVLAQAEGEWDGPIDVCRPGATYEVGVALK